MNIREFFSKNNGVFVVILALLATAGLYISLLKFLGIPYLQTFAGNNILWVLVFVVFVLLIRQAIKVTDNRIRVFSLIAAAVISWIQIVGHSLHMYSDLRLLDESFMHIVQNGMEFVGLAVLFYSCFVVVYDYLTKRTFEDSGQWDNALFGNTKKAFFLIWLIIFLVWIPYFLIYYPGVLTPDSIYQIKQAIDVSVLDNGHPIFHTFIIGICMRIGEAFGGMMAGVAIYSILQMVLMAGIFSFSIYYMGKRDISRDLRVLTFIFFAFFPVHAMYSITMWKNILFSGVMVLFTIAIIEIIRKPEQFVTDKKYMAYFIITALLVMILQNNGIHVLILSFIIFIIFMKALRKKVLFVFIIIVLANIIYTGPVYYALDVHRMPPGYAITDVSVQQFARVVIERGDDLTEEEFSSIHRFLNFEDADDLRMIYNPRLADPIRKRFNNEFYAENTLLFYSTWMKMSLRFPRVFMESYLANSYGYWYPQVKPLLVRTTIHNNKFGLERQSILSPEDYNAFNAIGLHEMHKIPIVSMLYSIGFFTILLLLTCILLIIKRQYRLLLACVPVVFIFITTTVSPVFAEYRYVYSMILCLPILASFTLQAKRE